MRYTPPNDGRIRPRVLNWLRCEGLSRCDRGLIGDTMLRPQPKRPMETVVDLGPLMHAVHSAALVTLVDQIDGVPQLDRTDEDQGERFRTAIGPLLEPADDPAAWDAPEPDPDRAARRARLRAAVDVALFTPGAADGRSLARPVVPPCRRPPAGLPKWPVPALVIRRGGVRVRHLLGT